VRGRARVVVSASLLVAAATAGAVVGFAFGAAATVLRVAPATPLVAATSIVAAVLLDLIVQRTGQPRAPAVRTQVPVEWTTLLPLPTAAALYGVRLGVGPLTLATPWAWWVAALIGASGGAGISALVGGAFGAARILTILTASRVAEGAMPTRMARLRRLEPTVSVALAALIFAVAASSLAMGRA